MTPEDRNAKLEAQIEKLQDDLYKLQADHADLHRQLRADQAELHRQLRADQADLHRQLRADQAETNKQVADAVRTGMQNTQDDLRKAIDDLRKAVLGSENKKT
jgi:molecular chaperone GrpE (heat shock protein)